MKKLPIWLLLIAVLAETGALAEKHQVVFLVDQSGSMSRQHGPGNSWGPNDPQGHRRGAVLLSFDTIKDELVRQQDESVTFHFHVVEFGSSVVVRDEVELRFDPANPQAPKVARETLKRILQMPAPGDTETDTRGGLEKVAQLLGAQPPARTHTLLITDGKPYVKGGSGGNLASSVGYRSALEDLAARIVGQGSLDVLGIVGPADRPQYWPEWGQFWGRASNGRAHDAAQAVDVSAVVHTIVLPWLGLTEGTPDNPYYCPPYLESVTLTVFKAQRGEGVIVKDALGRSLSNSLPGVRLIREDTYDRLTVEDPPPGLWQIDRSAYRVALTVTYRRIQRVEPRAGINVAQPVGFRYEVLATDGHPFRELPAYPVTAVLQIDEAGGRQSSVALHHEGGGIFAVALPYEFQQAGEARLTFRATAPVNGQDVEVFSTVDTLPITDADLIVLEAGESIPAFLPLHFGSARLQPKLTVLRHVAGRSGTPLTWTEISSSPTDLLSIRLVGHDGVALPGWESWRPLVLDGEGRLSTEAAVAATSWDRLLRRPQEFFVQVAVNPRALAEGYVVRELHRSAEPGEPAEFHREAAQPKLLADPLALPVVAREPGLSYLLTLLAGGVLFAGFGYLLFRLLGRAGYWLADRLSKRSLMVVIRPAGGTDADGVRKPLTGVAGRSFRKGAVGLILGEDYDNPDWKPEWLKLRRRFRPWSGRAEVALRYPVSSGRKAPKATTVVREGEGPRRLRDMEKAEVFLEVLKSGKPTNETVTMDF